MRFLFIGAVLCSLSLAVAKPTTQPTTKEAAKKFPTPAELIAKMQKNQADTEAKAQVACFTIGSPLTEKPADFSWFSRDESPTLHRFLERLEWARGDTEIEAINITLSAGAEVSLSQGQEIRDVLKSLVRAGKPVYVYADGYDTATYTLASGADHVCLLEGGQLMMPGVGIEAMFLKGAFDKVGVKADYVQIGEYKGAEEPYTRTEPSEESRHELNKLMDSMYSQIIDGIAEHRKLPKDVVQRLIDDCLITGKRAQAAGLIDHLTDVTGVDDLIAKSLDNEIDLIEDYGTEERPKIDFSNPFTLLGSLTKKEEPSDLPQVAIIYAAGTIVDGEGEQGMLSSEEVVGSEALRRAFDTALRDDKIKAIVLRIDSPGGSALASEVMWQASRRLAVKKPMVVSVGSMAASGGYYLATSCDTIFADRTAIVGSIGVVGGKFVTKDLYDKLGITTEAFTRGANADLFSSSQPFTERQRTLVTNWMKETYEQFTERVMLTRKGKIKDIDAVARGRIFVAADAQKLGMVDELGGLMDALTFAAGRAKLASDEYDVRVLPAPRTLGDYLTGNDPDAQLKMPGVSIAADSLLRALSPQSARLLTRQIRMIQLLQERPVILAMPYSVEVK